jgi:hypothetical protein
MDKIREEVIYQLNIKFLIKYRHKIISSTMSKLIKLNKRCLKSTIKFIKGSNLTKQLKPYQIFQIQNNIPTHFSLQNTSSSYNSSRYSSNCCISNSNSMAITQIILKGTKQTFKLILNTRGRIKYLNSKYNSHIFNKNKIIQMLTMNNLK